MFTIHFQTFQPIALSLLTSFSQILLPFSSSSCFKHFGTSLGHLWSFPLSIFLYSSLVQGITFSTFHIYQVSFNYKCTKMFVQGLEIEFQQLFVQIYRSNVQRGVLMVKPEAYSRKDCHKGNSPRLTAVSLPISKP